MRGRTLWHINSTAEGGGVAELLRSCLGYLRDGAIDTRWLVFQGDRPFFDITKRIHNRLHGDLGRRRSARLLASAGTSPR